MFCPHCGNQLDDGSLFCPSCGGRIDAGAETQPDVKTQRDAETQPAAEAQPAAAQWEYPEDFTLGNTAAPFAEPAFAAPEFDAPKPKKQKTRKKLSKKAIIGLVSGFAAVAVVVTLVAVNFQKIRGAFILAFGSDESYLEFVEEKQAKTYAKAISSLYAAPSNAFDSSGTSKVSFTANEALLSTFLKELGVDYNGELSFLSEMGLETDYNLTEEGMSYNVGLVVSGQPIVTAEMTMDFNSQTIYYAFPELSSKVLTMQIPQAAYGGTGYQEAMEMISKLGEILPSEKEMANLLERYIGAAVGAVEKVTVDKEDFVVSGVSQSCRKITMRISEKTLLDIEIAILQEVKTDDTLRDIYQRVMNAALQANSYGGMVTSDQLMSTYDLLLMQLDQVILQLQRQIPSASTEEICVIYDYVDSSHDVIGREVKVDGETVLFYGTATDGKKTATKVSLGDRICLQGSGTQSGNKVTGEYVLTVGNEEGRFGDGYYDEELGYYVEGGYESRYVEHEICRFLLTDFDTKSIRDGKANGKVRIIPSEELLSELLGSRLAATVMNVSVEFGFETSGSDTNMDVNLLLGESVMFGMHMDNTVSGGKKLSIPSGDLLDMQGWNAEQVFLNSLSFDKVRNALRNTNLPSEIISYLEDAIKELELRLAGSNNYYYGYDY